MIYRQSKLKALVTNIAMERIKAVEAADMLVTCFAHVRHNGTSWVC